MAAIMAVAMLALPGVGSGQAPNPAAPQSAVPKPFFRTMPAGHLKDNYGSPGHDPNLYAPGMRFPIDAPTTLNSQLRNPGGQLAGGQCSLSNYNEEWADTFCETRSADRNSLNCTSRAIHQGIDMRGGTVDTCRQLEQGTRDNVRLVAVYDGVIDRIGSYSVQLKTDHGVFTYLHLNMASLPYARKDLPFAVKAGQLIGFMSKDFGGQPTTFHLHLEHRLTIAGKGTVPVPLYCDLVLAYERDRGKQHVMVDGSPRCDGAASAPVAAAPMTATVPPAASPTTVTAAGTAVTAASFWRHAGSEMRLVANGQRRQIVYEAPREGLAGLVQPGDWLFDGERIDDRFKGRARVFNPGCPPQEYEVDGPILNSGMRIELRGNRPVPAGGDCRARFRPDLLEFTFLRSGKPAVAVASASSEPASPTADRPPAGPEPSPAPAAGPDAAPVAAAATATVVEFQRPQCTRERCVDRGRFLQAFEAFHKVNGNKRYRDARLWPYQRDALTALLNIWDTTPELVGDKRLAYILATSYHETTNAIYPTRECSCRTNAGAIACSKRLHVAGKAQNYYLRDAETHHSYYGRGQTQLTLKDNFSRVGRLLKLGDRLVWSPDDALSLDVSSRNAVFGLYHGWYRAGNAVKSISFDNDADWVNARAVLIAKQRDADVVAGFGRKITTFVSFIPRAEFDKLYGAAPPPMAAPIMAQPVPPPVVSPVPTPPAMPVPAPVAVAPLPTAVVATPQPTFPPPNPASDRLRQGLVDLDLLATDLQQRSVDLSKRIAGLKALVDAQADLRVAAYQPGDKSANPSTASDAPLEVAVDFQTTWPAGHYESPWCKLSDDDDKSAMALPPEDDPVYLRYFKD